MVVYDFEVPFRDPPLLLRMPYFRRRKVERNESKNNRRGKEQIFKCEADIVVKVIGSSVYRLSESRDFLLLCIGSPCPASIIIYFTSGLAKNEPSFQKTCFIVIPTQLLYMRNSVNNGQPPLRLQPGLESNSKIHPQAPMKGFEFLRYNIHEPAQPNNWSP